MRKENKVGLYSIGNLILQNVFHHLPYFLLRLMAQLIQVEDSILAHGKKAMPTNMGNRIGAHRNDFNIALVMG